MRKSTSGLLFVTLVLGVFIAFSIRPQRVTAQSWTLVVPTQHEVLAIVSLPGEDPQREAVDVPTLIVGAARRWEVDERTLLRVAWCESRYDPDAVGAGGVAGLFQFAPITWGWVSERVGYPGASPHNVHANVEAAAWLFKTEGPKHWGCK